MYMYVHVYVHTCTYTGFNGITCNGYSGYSGCIRCKGYSGCSGCISCNDCTKFHLGVWHLSLVVLAEQIYM